nr:hypothetical protein CFP56_42409 [Quercus suber]
MQKEGPQTDFRTGSISLRATSSKFYFPQVLFPSGPHRTGSFLNSKQIRLARRRANYARRRQQTLGGDITLVGSPANLNEDVVHSNSTSSCVSLIPPNREATPSCRLTHIRNLARNMPIERNAMQETNGLPPIYPTIMPNDFEAGPSHINSDVNDGVERTEEVDKKNDQNHRDGYREQVKFFFYILYSLSFTDGTHMAWTSCHCRPKKKKKSSSSIP